MYCFLTFALKSNYLGKLYIYRTRAIITRGLYTFYPLFEVHLCTVTFGLMYGYYSRAVSNQERVIVARVRYIYASQGNLSQNSEKKV